MSATDTVLLAERLGERFRDRVRQLTEPWDHSAWSQSYRVEFDTRDALYVKGTPRTREEARITSFLHRYDPGHIPAVLDQDFLPEQEWRWFLLEDIGDCNQTGSITRECSIRAAFYLGRLQHIVSHHTQGAGYLPQCGAGGMQASLTSVCDWALRTASEEMREEFLAFRSSVARSTTYFRSLQQTLSLLPPTCIHGDLWSGNIACREGTVSFIDWGDALWGVGSVSIVNLVTTASEDLSGHSGEIWEAYARGWERDLTEQLIEASRVAWLVSSLIIDVEIAKCCNDAIDILPGLIPGVRDLVALWE
jgi:hypothetical protein